MTNKAWAVLLLVASAWGQTRLAWPQLAPGGTQPRARWQKGLVGHPISELQVAIPAYTVTTEGDNVIRVYGPRSQSCIVTVARNFSGLVQVFFYSGRVGIMAGHNAANRYEPTVDHVDIAGPCVPVDTDADHYPRGIHAFVFFASVGQPTGAAPLTGLVAPFMPVSYDMDARGLLRVSGYNGEAIR